MEKWILIVSNLVLARPVYVYINGFMQPNLPLKNKLIEMADAGVTHILLGYYVPGLNYHGDCINALQSWFNTNDLTKNSTISELHSKGTKLMMTTGGSVMGNAWQSMNPDSYGKQFCSISQEWFLDGVDFDLEGIVGSDRKSIKWIISATKACREVMPNGTITSAPQGVYMDPRWGRGIAGNAWTDIALYGKHDAMLIQKFDQGKFMNDQTYEGLFDPKNRTSIGYLMQKYPGLPKAMFTLGKPPGPNIAMNDSGFIKFDTLKKYVCKAEKDLGYEAGIMVWHTPQLASMMDDIGKLTSPCDAKDTLETNLSLTTLDSSTSALNIDSWKAQFYPFRCNKVLHNGTIWVNEWRASSRDEPSEERESDGPWKRKESNLSTCQ